MTWPSPAIRGTPARRTPWRRRAGTLVAVGGLIAIGWHAALAQGSLVEDWRWVRYGVEEGLPSTLVHAVARGSNGTIWAATERGPAWFDGYRWRRVRDEAGHVLPAARTLALAATEDGVVHFLLEGELWQVLDGDTHAHRVPRLSPMADWAGLPVHASDANWAIFADSGKFKLARRVDEVWLIEPWPGVGPRETRELRLQVGANGHLLLSSGLELWERRDGRWVPQPPFTGGAGGVTRFAGRGDTDREWMVVRGPDERQGVWTRGLRGNAPWQKVAAFGVEVPPVFAAGPGATAVGILDAGDFLYTDGSPWRRLLMPSSIAPVTGAVFGPAGNVWFATRSGVVFWRRVSARWSQWRAAAATPANRVNGIAVSAEGGVVAATAGGVAYLEPDERLRIDAGLPTVPFTAVAWSRTGALWAGSGGAAAGVFERTHAGWRHRTDAPGLERAGIHRIVIGLDGTLWLLGLPLGANGRGGVWRVTDERIEAWPLPPELQGARFFDMVEDSSGARWFGTSRGVAHERQGRFTMVALPAGRTKDIPFSLALGDSEQVLVALRPSGVVQIARDLRVASVARDPAPTGQVTVHRAADGRTWAANADGVWVLAGGVWSKLTRAFGLPTPNVWPIVAASGDLYVGTMGAGVLRLRTQELYTATPRVFTQAPRIVDGTLTLRWSAATERGAVPSEDLQTRWRIDGGPWSAWSTTDVATPEFHIPWRRHTLAVEARTPIGVTTREPAVLTFAVPSPPWWRRSVLLTAAALVSALAWLTVLLVRRRRTQEILARRVREAERLELVGSFAAGMAHELNNLLTVISMNAELVEDPPDSESSSPSAEIQRAVRQAAGQLKSVLAYTRDLALVLGPVDLAELLRARRDEVDALFPEGVHTRWTIPSEPVMVMAESNAIAAILRTLAEHTRARLGDAGTFDVSLQTVRLDTQRSARLGLDPAAGHIELVIADSGEALSEEQARRLFEPAFPTRERPDSGLVLVQGLMRRFRGAVHVPSSPDGGLAFHLYFVAPPSGTH